MPRVAGRRRPRLYSGCWRPNEVREEALLAPAKRTPGRLPSARVRGERPIFHFLLRPDLVVSPAFVVFQFDQTLGLMSSSKSEKFS